MILNFLFGHRPYVRNTRLKMKSTTHDLQQEEFQLHTSSLRGNSMFVQQRPKNKIKKTKLTKIFKTTSFPLSFWPPPYVNILPFRTYI